MGPRHGKASPPGLAQSPRHAMPSALSILSMQTDWADGARTAPPVTSSHPRGGVSARRSRGEEGVLGVLL